MPKTPVTPELAATLKTVRTQKGIQAKTLAEHIGKSNAYITKLEKAEIKFIDNTLLDEIFSFIMGDDVDSDAIAKKTQELKKQKLSDEEIDNQLWFVNFDTVYRRLPIPEKLIQFINERIEFNRIDREVLVIRINNNEALTIEEKNDESIEYNRWYSIKENDQSIKINLSLELVNDILDRKEVFSSYVFVFCILHYVLKIEKYGDRVDLSREENIALMNETTQTLNQFKFYSLAEKNNIIINAENQDQLNEIWNSFDTENQEILSDILSGFRYASELDIANTNPRLKSFSENMHWDLWFMLKLISFNFSSMDDLSTTLKKELLNEIEELIQKYNSLPTAQKKVETY